MGSLLYNKRLIKKLVADLKIHVVINDFSHSLPITVSNDLLYIYNYVDDYANFHKNPLIKKLINRYVHGEIEKSDILAAGSSTLGRKVIEKGWKNNFFWLPGGIDRNVFEIISEEKILAIRKKYKLENKIVLGHIGYQNKRSGLNFLLNVFTRTRSLFPKVALFIVGPGNEANRLAKIYKNDKNIIFTGPIDPEEIFGYFLASDIGVLPYIKRQDLESSFPMRLFDFIGARKIVITWPFGDLKLLNFPNVILTERKAHKWAEAILKVKNVKWNPEWDYLIEEFSLKRIVGDLKRLIQIQLKKKGIKLQ